MTDAQKAVTGTIAKVGTFIWKKREKETKSDKNYEIVTGSDRVFKK